MSLLKRPASVAFDTEDKPLPVPHPNDHIIFYDFVMFMVAYVMVATGKNDVEYILFGGGASMNDILTWIIKGRADKCCNMSGRMFNTLLKQYPLWMRFPEQSKGVLGEARFEITLFRRKFIQVVGSICFRRMLVDFDGVKTYQTTEGLLGEMHQNMLQPEIWVDTKVDLEKIRAKVESLKAIRDSWAKLSE